MTFVEVSGHACRARDEERYAKDCSTIDSFAGGAERSRVDWVRAVIALLQWAPPVEVRPKLHGPSPEALARGLVVGAVVRPASRGPGGARMTVLGHSALGYVATCDGLWHASTLTVVLPPPALDSWLLTHEGVIAAYRKATTTQDLCAATIAEARRLVELARGGAR